MTVLPLPLVTNETIKLCKEGTWQEMKDGCNAFPPSHRLQSGLVRFDLLGGDAGNRPQRRAGRPARELSDSACAERLPLRATSAYPDEFAAGPVG